MAQVELVENIVALFLGPLCCSEGRERAGHRPVGWRGGRELHVLLHRRCRHHDRRLWGRDRRIDAHELLDQRVLGCVRRGRGTLAQLQQAVEPRRHRVVLLDNAVQERGRLRRLRRARGHGVLRLAELLVEVLEGRSLSADERLVLLCLVLERGLEGQHALLVLAPGRLEALPLAGNELGELGHANLRLDRGVLGLLK
eukprot:10024499-Lingulodinium_polyedra.AAC.2